MWVPSPRKVRALLNHVPKLNPQVWVDNLVRELPSYLAECMATPAHGRTRMLRLSGTSRDSNGWGSDTAPHCSLCVHKRVFSMLKTVVDDRRVKACKIAKQHL